MDEAVFIAQYTFLATPAVIEEESRILGKIARRLRCEYVIRFEDDGKSISCWRPVPATRSISPGAAGTSSARPTSTAA